MKQQDPYYTRGAYFIHFSEYIGPLARANVTILCLDEKTN